MPLTDAKVRNAKPNDKPIKFADGGSLVLEVRPNGSKLWRYRYRIDGKESMLSLGQYFNDKREGHVGLEEARAARDAARVLVKQGINPAAQRQSEKLVAQLESANTFKTVTEEWIGKKKGHWTPYYLRQVERFMASDVFPKIGDMPIRDVKAAHLLAIIQKAESRGAETVAVLIRQWASAVFRYAVSTLRADSDPAAALKGAIHRPKVQHHKPLDREGIKKFLDALAEYGGDLATVINLKLLMRTFVRPSELREAKWSEFDLDSAIWVVPAPRMKMREPHAVPLSLQAVQLLRDLHKLTGHRPMLFPNTRRADACMSNTTTNRALEYLGFAGQFSSHGFRSTASTMLNELGYRADVIERQLAHKERNAVRRSYNQAEYMPERVLMMQQWSDLIDQIAAGGDKVVAIGKLAA